MWLFREMSFYFFVYRVVYALGTLGCVRGNNVVLVGYENWYLNCSGVFTFVVESE